MTGGPAIEALTRRLIDTPGDFLADGTSVPAVVGDLFARWGASSLDSDQATAFRGQGRNFLLCVAVTSWLLADPRLARSPPPFGPAWTFLTEDLRVLSEHVPAEAFVADADHREELARRVLLALGLVPDGETEAQAADRLSALDSVERDRVLAATRAAEERAAAVRAAMHARAAAEAASKASRE